MDPITLLAEGEVALPVLTAAIAGWKDELLLIGGLGIGVAAAPFLLKRGFAFLKGLIKA